MMIRSNKKYSKQLYLDDAIMTDKDGNDISLIDVIPDTSENIDDKVHRDMVFEKVSKIIDKKLNERERKVIYMRYGVCGYDAYTQLEISKILKISRSYISRIETKALQIIKANVDKNLY